MGPNMATKQELKGQSTSLPANLAVVALIDASTCAAVGAMSLSWWHEQVRIGNAPAPVMRKPRCTRWRASDVHSFWLQCAEESAAKSKVAEEVTARATKASVKAREKAAQKAVGKTAMPFDVSATNPAIA